MKVLKRFFQFVGLIIISVILIVIIVGCVVLIPSNFSIHESDNNHKYSKVLSDIDNLTTVNPRFIDVAMLASHDSNTYAIDINNNLDETAPKALSTFFPIAKNYLKRFAVTQHHSIYDQIMQGVRFLQIKVSYQDDDYYTTHTIISNKLSDCVTDILKYLTSSEASGEMLGVYFHFVNLGNKTYEDFHKYVAQIKYNNKSLYDFVNYSKVDAKNEDNGYLKIKDLRYNDITNYGTKPGVVLIDLHNTNKPEWEDKNNDTYPYSFDLDSYILNPWHNHTSTNLLLSDIEKTYNKFKNDQEVLDNKLRINQTQAAMSTKSFRDTVNILTSGSLLSIAEKHNLDVLNLDYFDDMLSVMPVFQVDYVTSTYKDFNKLVNEKIRKHNEKLINS